MECYPEHTTAKGEIAIEWCRSIGLDLLPWQEYALSVLLGEDDMHKYACREFGYIVARQNGKGSVLMARELAGLFLFNEGLILHSAHEFKTAQEAFLRTAEIIDSNPELVKQLKGGTVARGKRTSHGEEGYELASGARLRFVARSKSSGRGFSADVIVLDEAYELSEKAISALRHTIKTRPNPQIIYTSTAPPIDEPSTVLRQVRKRALENSASRFGYLEWSAPYEATQDLANVDYWRMANPALGYLFELDALQSDYEARASDDEFAIEVLSITNDLMDEEFISSESWGALTDMTAARQGAFSVGLSVSEKGKKASVAIAAREASGRFLVRLVHQQRTTKDLVKKVAEIVNKRGGKVYLNAGAPAGSLILDLKDAGVTVEECNTRAYAQACGALAKSVDNDELRHPGQPSLNLAVKHAKGRKSGDLWVWATAGDADITPLESVTLALQGFRSSLVEESKPQKVSNAFYSYA